MKIPTPALLLVLLVSLGAQTGPSLPPLSSVGREAVVGELRDKAQGLRMWAELYYGTDAADLGQLWAADAYDAAADLVESHDDNPRPDPVKVRHAQELIVINALRVAAGLEPYDVYPEQ